MRARMRRSGFTLVEMLVGMLLMSMIVLVVHSLATQIAAAARAGEAAQRALDREANPRRWLKAAFLSCETGPETAPFDGAPDSLSFDAWLEQPGGWFARRTIELKVKDNQLIATVGSQERVHLAESVSRVEFGYLLEQGGESRWVEAWRAKLRAPVAVRIVLERSIRITGSSADTLVFLLKERG